MEAGLLEEINVDKITNMEDNGIGHVEWDKDKPWSGIIKLANGKTARVEFDIDESGEQAARKTLKHLVTNETQIRRRVAVSLLKYCRDWIDDDIATPEKLASRIELADILFYEGGDGQLYYEADDDLFTDHTVCVWFDAAGEIEDEVSLEG